LAIKVVRFSPNRAAAPLGPPTIHPAACKARKIRALVERSVNEPIERLTPGIFEYKYALLVVLGQSRPVRRQDTPPERRMPYVQAISFDYHPAILDTHEYPSRLYGIAEQLET